MLAPNYMLILALATVEVQNQEWATAYDHEGNVYYYNNFTGASQYENPFE